ncbi:MAG TPA: N-acetylmuramoyl-L-alanine amidase-like domain-containing protein [Longimicrobiaceae bacterium]
MTLSRRDLLRNAIGFASAMAIPAPLLGCLEGGREGSAAAATDGAGPALSESPFTPPPSPEDEERLIRWAGVLREEGLVDADDSTGRAATRVGELAAGTPYEPYTLEQYIRVADGPPRAEPLTLHLDRFDCVTLVESCLAIGRVAHAEGPVQWQAFAREMERMRYRGGKREGYTSRLHYFSEWLSDNERRGLVRLLGEELGARPDTRPLRFMSSHPDSYPALAYPEILAEIEAMERTLDDEPRWVVPTDRIAAVETQIETGDVLAFATSIEGLDVTHSAFAYRDDGGVLRVLHAPLSGGVVEITRSTVPEYVAAIRSSTGILVARPLWGLAR